MSESKRTSGWEARSLRRALERQVETTRDLAARLQEYDRRALVDCHGRGHEDGSQLCRECLLWDKINLADALKSAAPSHPLLERRHVRPGLWRRLAGAWQEFKDICRELTEPL